MLIVLPSTPTTQAASEYLTSIGYEHSVIPVPESLGYKTGSDIAIYTVAENQGDYAMTLTKERFVVMRVFKDFVLDEA
ncbi:MAG: hypothetical protein KTR14_09220 [Vampirovibrio sp.]|nr:hypothetical protein [Vampirovibrio sp.]